MALCLKVPNYGIFPITRLHTWLQKYTQDYDVVDTNFYDHIVYIRDPKVLTLMLLKYDLTTIEVISDIYK